MASCMGISVLFLNYVWLSSVSLSHHFVSKLPRLATVRYQPAASGVRSLVGRARCCHDRRRRVEVRISLTRGTTARLICTVLAALLGSVGIITISASPAGATTVVTPLSQGD